MTSTTVLKHETLQAPPVDLAPGELTLGRAPDNQVSINDSTVSAHHARIYTYFYVSYIEDLQSTNGTFVNGKRITKHLLKPGDVIHLGSYPMRMDLKFGAQAASKTA
jgi:pSer/pThr/pTyr-binding forkhead associated (FHA) protein